MPRTRIVLSAYGRRFEGVNYRRARGIVVREQKQGAAIGAVAGVFPGEREEVKGDTESNVLSVRIKPT